MEHSGSHSEIIESLFRQYGNAIYRYVRYSLPEEIDAADVVQEVFLRAFRAMPGFNAKAEIKTWLFRIARNYVYDLLRKKRHERRYMLSQHVNSNLLSEQLDSVLEIEDALSQLSIAQQQVLNLRLIQDLSVAETAAILNWTEAKVKINYYRAKKQLQMLLRDEYGDTSESVGREGDSSERR